MTIIDQSLNVQINKPRKVGRPRTKNLNKDDEKPEEKTHKKRGRKPRGGKVVPISTSPKTKYIPQQNVILHLKCSSIDLQNECISNSNNYSCDNFKDSIFNKGDNFNNNFQSHSQSVISNNEDNKNIGINHHNNDNNLNDSQDNSVVWEKINNLAINLHNNSISNNKSCCFWDTCSFDNPPLYIPKYVVNDVYQCYGCFCSPECATAYLMNEQIDTSTRFERYHLLNHLYGKIYNYTKNIKPAPEPYHTLSKYYGNLSIQEYRQELKSERILIIVDKPLTRVLPELHEDNDLLSINSKVISSNNFKLRRNGDKISKRNALTDNFNFKQS